MKLPSVKPESVPIIIDTREQNPYSFSGFNTCRATLSTGDYSVAGMERSGVAIERKNLMDAVGVCGAGRSRFMRELDRLKAFEVGIVLIESTWRTIEEGTWKTPRMKMTPQHVLGSITSWISQGHNVIVAPRPMAERIARSVLCHAARHRLAEVKPLIDALSSSEVAI